MRLPRKLRGRWPIFSGSTQITGTIGDSVDNLVNFAQGIKTAAASTFLGTITVGINDTGHDVKFFGATSGKYWLWDESADSVILLGAVNQTGNYQLTGTLTVGVDDTGHDVKLFGATASAYLLWDESADALLLAGVARLDLSSATVAAANTDGGLIKAGTSGARVVEDTANMKFVSFYFDNGATSGTSVGFYNRLYVTGAGGSGTSFRTYTTVEDVAAATADGYQASLSFGTSGKITGLGVAGRNTLELPNSAITGGAGTYAALMASLYSGASTDISGATVVSFIRFANEGSATGNVDDYACLFELAGGAIGAGNVMAAKSSAAVSHTMRVKGPDGNTYYLMVSDTQ